MDLNLEFVTKNSFCHEFAARKCNYELSHAQRARSLVNCILKVSILTITNVPCRAVRLLPDVLGRGVLVDPTCITQCMIMCSIVLASIYGMLGSQ